MPTNRRSPWVWLGTWIAMCVVAAAAGRIVQASAGDAPANAGVAPEQTPAARVAEPARGKRVTDPREPTVDAESVARGEIIIRPTGRKVRVVSVSGKEQRMAASPATTTTRKLDDGSEYTDRSVRLPLAYNPRENFTGVYGAELNLPLDYGAYGSYGYAAPCYPSVIGHSYGYGYGRGYGSRYGYGYGGGLGCDYGGGFHRSAGSTLGFSRSTSVWTPSGGGSSSPSRGHGARWSSR